MNEVRPVHKGVGVSAVAWAYVFALVLLPLLAVMWTVIQDPWPVLHMLVDERALGALQRTTLLALLVVVINGAFGMLGALVVTRQSFRWRKALIACVDLPLSLSPVVIGLAFFVLFGRQGWLSPVLETLGVPIVFRFSGMVLVTLFVTLPFVMREVALVLMEVGEHEEEAATTLGASGWQVFRFVTLPNVAGGLVSGCVLVASRAMGEFGAVLVIGGAISGRTETATTFIYHAIEERQLTVAYGMSLVLCSLLIGVVAMFRSIRERVQR